MILYQFNDMILNHIKNNDLIVSDYTVNSKTNKLTIILTDQSLSNNEPRDIKLIFNNFKVSHEKFEIKNQIVESVYVSDFVSYFKSKYFVGSALVIRNSKNEKEKITITGA